MPSISPGGVFGAIEMRAPWLSPSRVSRSPYQDGTNSSESCGRELGPDALQVGVEPPGVEEAGAVRVGLGRDCADERRGARRRDQQHVLAGLDVRPDLDDQLGVAGEQGVVHGAEAYSVRPGRLCCTAVPPL